MVKKLYVEKDRMQSVASERFAFWQILMIAVGSAIAYFLLTLAINNFALQPIWCSAQNFNSGICGSSETISGNVALVIVAIFATLSLARIAVYRSMLVMIATAVIMWGAGRWLLYIAPQIVLLWDILIFVLSIVGLTFIVRRFRFFVALLLTIAIVVIARFGFILS